MTRADPGPDAWPLVPDLGADIPTRVRSGVGSRHAVGAVAAAAGPRTVLVTGASFATNPGAEGVLAALADAGIAIVARVEARGEPDAAAVLELAATVDATGADSIVAVGGGSVLDLAKAAGQRPDASRLATLLGGTRTEVAGVPVIALPTTAGSGAEVSHGAIVTDPVSGRKRGVRGPGVAARDAIVDPELMLGAPPAVVAAAGFDAIAHAVETSASRAASDATVARAGSALADLLASVPRAVVDPDDRDALATAAYAAMRMGINLATSTTCLPHRLQYPVGARTGTGHARGVAALTPAWLHRTRDVAPGSLAPLGRAAGLVAPDADDRDAAGALVERVLAHLAATGMMVRLGDLGITAGDVDALVDAVEGSVANDPGPTAPSDLRDLYLASL